MEKLKAINTRIVKKQRVRIVAGIGQVIIGLVLIGKFVYQKGITDCQNAISNEFPEEYAQMTEKVVAEFEKNT